MKYFIKGYFRSLLKRHYVKYDEQHRAVLAASIYSEQFLVVAMCLSQSINTVM